jgi:carboxypeptidase C (cathepsin A)
LNDELAAELNLNFLLEWYAHYPEFKNNDLYISGESYAGIYVPTFANAILMSTSSHSIPLRGVLVGNGCSGSETSSCGLDPSITTFDESPGGLQLRLAYDHALISKELYLNTSKTCGDHVIDQDRHCYVTRISGDPQINDTFCYQFNKTAWECALTNKSDSYYSCCNALWNSENNMGGMYSSSRSLDLFLLPNYHSKNRYQYLLHLWKVFT